MNEANTSVSRPHLFTSESVSEGHPDKIADQVSDAILDAFLRTDPQSRVACETMVTKDLVVLAGEFKTSVELFQRMERDAASIARSVLRDIGYRSSAMGIDPDSCEVRVAFNRQSPDISRGVERQSAVIGAGDQGLMFGYACEETAELMPLPIRLAHRLVERQAQMRKEGQLPWLRPDAKSQVTVRYEDGKPSAVEKVVLSTQHAPAIDTETIRAEVISQIIEPVIPEPLRSKGIEYLVNPTGRFEIGGPNADTGLTGRKIIVDTYGGSCPHGGGAFSGKDPTKVDRSGAYIARNIAKTIVAAGLASRCILQLAYAIGIAEPVSVYVELHGGGGLDERRVEDAIREQFDLTPAGIIRELDLLRPIYRKTAAYGHFGRQLPEFTWERTPHAKSLRERLLGYA
jgi:S-adenosylmethionine synthetase